MSKSDAK